MQNRIVEISTDNVHLSVSRGFMRVSQKGAELGQIPLPDISGLIVRGYGTSISLNLVARLASENIPVVLCGANQSPASVVWPIDGHHSQGRTMEGQAALSQPKQKQLWKSTIEAKIRAQANVLNFFGANAEDLYAMARRVKSGDSDNLEAQAARKYWPRLTQKVDPNFKRDQDLIGLNGWLNYGYTIVRAGMARSVLAAGLHPSFSLHHQSKGEALRLVSDLMEPFRPYLDLLVIKHFPEDDSGRDLTPDRKRHLAGVLNLDLKTEHGNSQVQMAMDRLAQSFASICTGENTKLDLPLGVAILGAEA